MRSAFMYYLTVCKDVFLAPRRFYRDMSITEGIRTAFYLLVGMLYLFAAISYTSSYFRGYFVVPALKVTAVTSVYAGAVLALMPFFYLFIMYSQSVFIYRIANFFGGSANFEGAFKILAFTFAIAPLVLIPYIGVVIAFYMLAIVIIGIKEVFDVDWISAVLTILFTYVFTAFLYLLLLGLPAFLAKLVDMKIS